MLVRLIVQYSTLGAVEWSHDDSALNKKKHKLLVEDLKICFYKLEN